MADQKISELVEKTIPVDADLLAIVDSEVTPNATKKALKSNIVRAFGRGWTADKLLKGAGAGVDPTEIDVSGGATIVRKTADEIVNNSVTLQNDDHLFFPVGANEVWGLQLVTRIICTTANTSAKGAFSVPTNGTIKRQTDMDGKALGDEADGTTTLEIGSTSANLTCISIIRYLYIGGDTAGNVQLQWAQLYQVVGDTTMKANSHIVAHKLD